MDQIQRNGEWWQRQPTGEWLRFDAASGQWMSAESPPPPPPPPAALDDGPFAPQSTGRRSRFAMPRISVPQIDRRVRIAGGLAVLVALLAVAGFFVFGGNEPAVDLVAAAGPIPEPEPLSKREQFIHDADQICAVYLAKSEALQEPRDAADLVPFLEEVASINQAATRAAKKLGVPKDARAGWNRFVGHPEDGQRIQRMISAVRTGNYPEFQRLATVMQKKGLQDAAWAESYGMKTCSQQSLRQA